jgi:hypothetical protein
MVRLGAAVRAPPEPLVGEQIAEFLAQLSASNLVKRILYRWRLGT